MNIPRLIPLLILDFYWNAMIWDKQQHGNGIKFIADNRIQYTSGIGQKSAFIDYVISNKEFRTITLEFIMHSYSYYSWMGFVKHPIKTENYHGQKLLNTIFHFDAKPISVGTAINLSRCVLRDYHVSVSGKTHPIIPLRTDNDIIYKFKEHDRFIFVFDFDKKICNVFLNWIDEKQRLKNSDHPTSLSFSSITDDLIPAYGHNSDPMSDVEFNVISYQNR